MEGITISGLTKKQTDQIQEYWMDVKEKFNAKDAEIKALKAKVQFLQNQIKEIR